MTAGRASIIAALPGVSCRQSPRSRVGNFWPDLFHVELTRHTGDTMNDKRKPADKSHSETSRERDRPFRESNDTLKHRGGTADFSIPPLTVTERNPVPTEPPKRKGK